MVPRREGAMTSDNPLVPNLKRAHAVLAQWRHAWSAWQASPGVALARARLDALLRDQRARVAVLLGGTATMTLLIAGLDHALPTLSNPGVAYLPFAAMLAYYWGWAYGAASTALLLACVYYFFNGPAARVKPLTAESAEQLGVLLAVSVFVLLLTQFARTRRIAAEREAERFAALNRVGAAVAGELDEARLLDLIARTARDLSGAQFAAFSLRPLDPFGVPLVPSEGNLFHLAAVVGASPEQEEHYRRTPLGGEGLLAPIFRHGHPVLVEDALQHTGAFHGSEQDVAAREQARAVAAAYAHGQAAASDLRSLGVPRWHPVVRSFLGAPLLDRRGEVRGGLLLGHSEPGRFTHEDEVLLVGLASQAAVALENARLFHAAQAQADELDAVFESIGDGITLIDDAGLVLRENAASEHLREVLRASGRAAEVTALLAAVAESTPEGGIGIPMSIDVPGEEGHSRTYVISAAPVPAVAPADGAKAPLRTSPHDPAPVPGIVVVWHDVTETRQRLAEQRRREEAEARRALLQTVLDELPSAVCLVRGLDARLVLTNRAGAAVWGAAWREGQPMRAFLQESGTRILAPDGRQLAPDETATLRALRTAADVRHFEEVIRQHDGTALPILANAVVVDAASLGLTEPDGEAEPAALLVLQDVTALKEAEQLKDEFIGIAAHELRTPMAALRGFAEMLVVQTARGNGAPLADWQQEAVAAIDQATTRLVDLTDDLLDVTRLQGGRLELRIEPADLVALVRRVVARTRVTAPERAIEVTAGAEHVVVAMDTTRIEQVVANLLSNAIKYSPSGGAVRVAVTEHAETGTACLAVRDEGIGIPAAQQAHLFSRFVRAENAKHEGISGTGLGLYLCRELVERHGGRIWFDSQEGQGSTFSVELPLARTDEVELEPPDTPAGATRTAVEREA
jgi:signal transduction histidine kinase/GAF domain-containing protein